LKTPQILKKNKKTFLPKNARSCADSQYYLDTKSYAYYLEKYFKKWSSHHSTLPLIYYQTHEMLGI